ncbi:MAG: methyl-accepting chemotaxis protein [Vicinamibacterales bacterium]
MIKDWTFGRKVGLALATMVVLTLAVAAIGILALRSVVERKDAVINVRAHNALLAERLSGLAHRQRGAVRDYLLYGDESFAVEVRTAEQQLDATLGELERSVITPEGLSLVRELRRIIEEYRGVTNRVLTDRGAGSADASGLANRELTPRRVALESSLRSFIEREQTLLEEGRADASRAADRAISGQFGVSALAIVVATVGALLLTRSVTTQVGAAVHSVQSSSAELQAAAHQQASSAKEQATAMAEITTTITELLATSRQIADSAQRVARIAEETAASARSGEETVGAASESVVAIRKQVDGIVTHMLDLGRQSQEIGGILEIINELADQTNILSVNAAIEAAGAGDAGRRFSVVAEEIRRLADRVAGSTKEIRGLIQEVRTAVNTTVMTTEATAKSTDAGVQQFAEVSTALRRIAGLVRATTDASREIELSTKQQASAVEQVNTGVADVAQGAKETEIAASQMLETVSQLSTLSRSLSTLIQSERLI